MQLEIIVVNELNHSQKDMFPFFGGPKILFKYLK